MVMPHRPANSYQAVVIVLLSLTAIILRSPLIMIFPTHLTAISCAISYIHHNCRMYHSLAVTVVFLRHSQHSLEDNHL